MRLPATSLVRQQPLPGETGLVPAGRPSSTAIPSGFGNRQPFLCARQREGRADRRHAGWADGLSAIFGLHVWPLLPSGTLASRPWPIMAAALQFEARVTGRGGHAAMPPTFVDPVVPAAAAIGALQARGYRAHALWLTVGCWHSLGPVPAGPLRASLKAHKAGVLLPGVLFCFSDKHAVCCIHWRRDSGPQCAAGYGRRPACCI